MSCLTKWDVKIQDCSYGEGWQNTSRIQSMYTGQSEFWNIFQKSVLASQAPVRRDCIGQYWQPWKQSRMQATCDQWRLYLVSTMGVWLDLDHTG